MLRLLVMTFTLLISLLQAKAETLLEAQLNLEERLTKVVQSYDERAYVFVSLEEDQKKVRLPSTPFIFESANLGSGERIKIKQMTVTIMTRMKDFPEQIDKVILNISSEYGVKATIEKVVVPIAKLEDEAESKDKDEPITEKHVSKIASYMDYVFAGGLGFGLLLFAFFILTQRKSNQISLEVLKEQMGKLGSSFENASLGSGVGEQVSSSESNSGTSGKIELSTSSSSIWEKFDNNSIEAIMSDCYWCFEDEYASYIWDKLGIDKRVELLNSGLVTHEYAAYICTLEGIDKEFAKDPYYLAPINVAHVSNDDLAQMVNENPALMNKISKMRQKTLPIKATERLKLVQADKTQVVDLSNIEKHDPSKQRVIKTKEVFTFASIEEEEEIISMSGEDIDVMERFPSLAWLLRLEEKQAFDLLATYTAKQLATFWIGPEDVLTKLEKSIPKKKAELMKSYLEKTQPVRNDSYNKIISLAIEQLRENESGTTGSLKQAA